MNLSLYLLTVLIWGTTWIALKWQLGVVAIPVSIVYRFGLAALVLFALLLLSRRLQVMNRRGHLICLAQGLCLFCVNFMCFLTASQWIPSGLVAVVFSTATLWNALNARVFFGQKIARNVLMGGALGLFGLGLLFWPELAGAARNPVLLGGQHAVEPATEGRSEAADHQRLGHGLWRGNVDGVVPGQRHTVRHRMECALPRLAAVSGHSGLGDWFHRLPDTGRSHGA